MLLSPRDFRGWLVLLALIPLAFAATYATEPAARRASFWGDDWKNKPLAERVRILPEAAVPSLRAELSEGRGASTLHPATDADYVLRDLREAMDELPESVTRLVDRRLIGVFLVEGLSDAEREMHNLGLALEVSGFWRQHAGTVILIDRDETDMRANLAMASMEYVPTGEYRGFRVQSRLARRGDNDRKTTLRYVLVHELGHLIDYDLGITPYSFNYAGETVGCGFTCLSWITPRRHRFSPNLDMAMRNIEAGNYEAFLEALPTTFAALSKSNFPSLYATTLPEEDFAESFAQYVHSVMLGHPWELTLRVNGTIRGRLGSCYLERRCPDKKVYFERLLGDPG